MTTDLKISIAALDSCGVQVISMTGNTEFLDVGDTVSITAYGEKSMTARVVQINSKNVRVITERDQLLDLPPMTLDEFSSHSRQQLRLVSNQLSQQQRNGTSYLVCAQGEEAVNVLWGGPMTEIKKIYDVAPNDLKNDMNPQIETSIIPLMLSKTPECPATNDTVTTACYKAALDYNKAINEATYKRFSLERTQADILLHWDNPETDRLVQSVFGYIMRLNGYDGASHNPGLAELDVQVDQAREALKKEAGAADK